MNFGKWEKGDRRVNINDMKPGPELDRYFANLIGYQSLTTGLNLDGTYGYVPAYSTSWSDMRLVIEEMQRRGWWIYVDQRSDTEYNVRFWHSVKGTWSEFVLSGPLPYVTVLAAIKAIQGEDA